MKYLVLSQHNYLAGRRPELAAARCWGPAGWRGRAGVPDARPPPGAHRGTARPDAPGAGRHGGPGPASAGARRVVISRRRGDGEAGGAAGAGERGSGHSGGFGLLSSEPVVPFAAGGGGGEQGKARAGLASWASLLRNSPPRGGGAGPGAELGRAGFLRLRGRRAVRKAARPPPRAPRGT